MTSRLRPPRPLTRPEEGWASLVLLLAMLLLVGLSVAASRSHALQDHAHAETLAVLMVSAGLSGYLVARSSIGVVRAHLIGAAAGAIVLVMVASGAVAAGGSLLALDGAALQLDIRQLGSRLTEESQLYLADAQATPTTLTFLVLGALCWTTGQFSAFSLFRYRRAGPAVMATGVMLFLDMALPATGPGSGALPALPVLATFSALAMLLLMRVQAVTQGRQWANRNMTDTDEVRRLFLRTGTLFVAAVTLAASTLTAVATAPPQQVDVGALEEPIQALGEELTRWLALVAVDVTPQGSGGFDDRLEVADVWEHGSGVAFVAQVDGGLRGNYWWASAFAEFDGRTWTRRQTSEEEVVAGQPFEVIADASGAGPLGISASISPRKAALATATVLGPSEVVTVDRDVLVRSLGDREGLTEVTFLENVASGEGYAVASAAHDYGDGSGTLTAAELRAAGTEYPGWIDRYLRVDAGASGPRTVAKAAEVAEQAASLERVDPYAKALLLQDQLRDLQYSTSIAGLCRSGENVPECLLRTETGFCQHFASTMVMVLRELEIPARLVNGYLPGTASEDGRYEVPMQALHAWVEVYFPDVGWVRFDPTPGNQLRQYEQQPTRFEEGEAPPSAGDSESPPPEEELDAGDVDAEPTASPALAGAADGGSDGGDILTTLLLTGSLAVVLLAAAAGAAPGPPAAAAPGGRWTGLPPHRQPGCPPGPWAASGADRVRVCGQPVPDDPLRARGALRRGPRSGGEGLRPARHHGRASCSPAPGVREDPHGPPAAVVEAAGLTDWLRQASRVQT